jgi:hypothetical protein
MFVCKTVIQQRLLYIWLSRGRFPANRLHVTILSCVLMTIDGVRIGDWIYWPHTGRNYKEIFHCYWFSHYKALHTRSSQSAVTSLRSSSQQWLFLYNVFTICFLATDFKTGTITVTLQISFYCSTFKFFKSQVKSSQSDFLYFSVLFQLNVVLLLLQLRNSANLYRSGKDTHHRKYMSRDRYSLLCDVTG